MHMSVTSGHGFGIHRKSFSEGSRNSEFVTGSGQSDLKASLMGGAYVGELRSSTSVPEQFGFLPLNSHQASDIPVQATTSAISLGSKSHPCEPSC